MIELYADFGYDSNNFIMAPYDWRLGFKQLQERDGYLMQIKHKIEMLSNIQKKKVVVIAHSLGANLFYYFMNWVERSLEPWEIEKLKAKNATSWTDLYVDSFVSVGGTYLG